MADLIIRIGAESKQFQDELDKITAKTEDTQSALSDLAKISGVAFAALTAEAALAIHAFAESEAASNKLSQALQNQGIYSKDLADQYKAQAKELEHLTGVDDDAIIAAQASLQGMIGQTEISKELTGSILDLAAAKDIDLQSATQLIGKGIEGQTTALKKLGIEIDDNLTKEERQAQIIDKVSQAYGGQAEAANKGLGSIKGLTSAFGDFQEAIGERLAPVVTVIVQKMTQFFEILSNNKPLMDLIVSLGTAAAVVTGLGVAIGVGGVALLSLTSALKAAGVAINLTTLSVRALVGATGIGLLVLLVTEVALNWNTVWPKMQAVFTAFVQNVSAIGTGLANIIGGIFNLRGGVEQIKTGIQQIKDAFSKGVSDFKTLDAAGKKDLQKQQSDHEDKQNAIKKAAADKAEKERQARETRELAARKAHLDLLTAQNENASTQLIEIDKKAADLTKSLAEARGADEIAQLQQQVDEINALKEQAQKDDIDRRLAFNEEIFNSNEEFAALSVEQQQLFLDQYQSQLLQATETADTTRMAAALKTAQDQTKANNTFLVEQQKYGTAYATINKVMHAEVIAGANKAFGELANLQQSSNSTLKAIGKAAAVANIVVKTAESAMNIYAGFSTIPIVGPVLGIAGAAAAIAFGAEQVGKVTSAAEGGLMTGGRPGQDSIPTLTMPGELVVPTKNFEDVVNGVAAQQNQDTTGAAGAPGATGNISVMIGLQPDAERFLTVQQNESRALGTFRGNG